MKKILALTLALLMILSMAACSVSDADDITVPQSDKQDNSTTAPVEDTEPVEDTTPAAPTLEEMVLVDDENCTIKITGVETDSFWGYGLKVYLENKTDLNLMFSVSNASVNGFMCDPLWAKEIAAGLKANETITWMSTEFDKNGIKTPTDIEMTFSVSDSDDWTADDLVNDTFTIYPLGEDAVVPYVRQSVEGETVLFDNEYCTMIVTGFDPDNLFGYSMNVYLENKTDKNLMFSMDDAAVNGFACDPFWASAIAAGKRSNTAITWFDSTLEENEITTIEKITGSITVSDADDWMADDLVNEAFEVTP